MKEKKKEAEIKELKVKGIPFLYNDEGMLIHPDYKNFKSKQSLPLNDIIEMEYNTI